ncbi:MAG TPA: RIP metalloprotease RseP [Bacilli bacterium]|nr:RIP metalloprotease RseP [Bacilli bacterium]
MTIIYFILILGITVFIHELGHFICAKKSGIYVYEFSLGMGPLIKTWKRKNDETNYSIRLFPIGGYVSMAGESVEDDANIPNNKKMQNKTWLQRFATIIAGITMNFILALLIFFIVGLVNGSPQNNAYIKYLDEDLPAYNSGLQVDDEVVKLNGKKINSDMLLLKLMINEDKVIRLTVKHKDGNYDNVIITPKKVTEDKKDTYKFGFGMYTKTKKGFIEAVKYAFTKFWSLIVQMASIIGYLFTGKLSLNNLSGPVGIYNVVGETAKTGFINLLFLLGYISLNVGFVNLLPIPAFDGGRLLFLIVEKIKGKPVSTKFENTVHTIGMMFLMLLMVIITYNDIVRIFFGG